MRVTAADVIQRITMKLISRPEQRPETKTGPLDELAALEDLKPRYHIYSKRIYPARKIAVFVRRTIHEEVRRYVDTLLEQQSSFNKLAVGLISQLTMSAEDHSAGIGELKKLTEALASANAAQLDVLKESINAVASSSATELHELKKSIGSLTSETFSRSTDLEKKIEKMEHDLGKAVNQQWNWMETARKEILYEFRRLVEKRSGSIIASKEVTAKSFEEKKRKMADGLRVNLGSGTLALEDYINVDSRQLEGVDLVSDVRRLPFDPNSISEMRLAHLIEHFDPYLMRHSVMPYWAGLLREGGKICIITPNWHAMINGYIDGTVPYADLLEVTFGSQEYEGNFHYTMYTLDTLRELLVACGFSNVKTVAERRRNGKCLELEVEATRSTKGAFL